MPLRLVIVLLLAGCASGTGIEGFDDSAPAPAEEHGDKDDLAEAPSRVPCAEYPPTVVGPFEGFRDDYEGGSVIGYETTFENGHQFELYLWQEGDFEGGFREGTFDMRLEPFCDACAAVYEDERILQATSGAVEITSVSDTHLRGLVTALILVEVDPVRARPVESGCSIQLESHEFDVTIPASL